MSFKEALSPNDVREYSPDFAHVVGVEKGEQIGGRFEVVDAIALSAIAGVLRGVDAQGDEIALKVPRQDIADALGYFVMEHDALITLEGCSEHVIQLKAFGLHDGDMPYFGFPLATGTLKDRKPVKTYEDAEEAWDDLMAAAEGLEAMHAEGWYHGDVKPPNVLVFENPHQIVISDLGSAAAISNEPLPHEMPLHDRVRRAISWTSEDDPALPFNGVCFSPHYTPGERLPTERRGIGRATPEGDVYAWGVMALEMLTNEHAFRGTGMAGRTLDREVGYSKPHIPRAYVDLMYECVSPHIVNRPSFTEIIATHQRIAEFAMAA
jgi:serine/threonine protein kinase